MNAHEPIEVRQLGLGELDEVAGANWAWVVVLVGAAADSLTDGAFSRPIGDLVRQYAESR